MRLTPWAVLGVCVTLSQAGCVRPATQLLVEVDSDATGTDGNCVRVEALRFPLDMPPEGDVRGFGLPEDATLPLSLGVTPPGGAEDRRVQLVAELRTDACGARAEGEALPRIRRVVRSGFAPGHSVRVPMFLAARCEDQLCSADTTCDPDTGACVEIPEIDPSRDAGSIAPRDVGAGIDAAATDAGSPLLDAPGVDAARADAPLPDAGSACPGGVVAPIAAGGTPDQFALAVGADGVRGQRAFILRGSGSDFAGTEPFGGAGGGSDYRPPPGLASGPIGVALTTDGAALMTFGLGGIELYPVFSFSGMSSLGGACPSTRCVIGMGGEFAVLRGPSTLTLTQVTVSPHGRGANASAGMSASVAASTSAGGIRPAGSGALVSWSSSGSCTLQRWPDFVAATGTLVVPDCTALDMAELTTAVAIAWTDASSAVHVGVADEGLAAIVQQRLLDPTQGAMQPVLVSSTVRGFRASWVDDLATPVVRSAQFDDGLTPLSEECASVAGHTLADYRRLQTAQLGATTSLEWAAMSDVYGRVLTD